MRKFTRDQYLEMSDRFNKMSFIYKIKTIRDNSDILTLANDGNWWGVKIKDGKIRQQQEEEDWCFSIESEWDYSEMLDLLSLLDLSSTDI